MLNTIFKYGVKEKKFTIRAVIYMISGTIFSILPYFVLYKIIDGLLSTQQLKMNTVLAYIAAIFICLTLFAYLYVLGLKNSHIAAYNILKNIRISLQHKLEKKPLGSIQELGTGNLKKMFVDDIDSLELLLAHALPEGIANVLVPILLYIAIFITDFRLGLLSLVTLPIGIWAMNVMFKVGTKYMNDYYMARVRMNNTIIEYITAWKWSRFLIRIWTLIKNIKRMYLITGILLSFGTSFAGPGWHCTQLCFRDSHFLCCRWVHGCSLTEC